MEFITVRELRTDTAAIRRKLAEDKDMVVTANGRPFAVLSHVEPAHLEEHLAAVRRSRLRGMIERIQAKAKADGLDKMTMDEIDAIIAQTRAERRQKEGVTP
jgi:antitoxin (DNA-binding transcriptional repressor) of toxin-antitoxin stability system